MISVQEKEPILTYYFPKNTVEDAESYTMSLKSEITHQTFLLTVIDSKKMSGYFSFSISFSDIPDGEYNYEIRTDDHLCAKGLLRIGVIAPKRKIYNPTEEYQCYDASDNGFTKYVSD